MRKYSCVALAAVAIATAGTSMAAQQRAPTVRLLDAPDASTKHVLGAPAATRQLRDGSLLVNDTERRQLLVFDPSLQNMRVPIDSTSGIENWYGPRPGGIIPYLGDSTLFIDPVGLSMSVLGPDGSIGRMASVPRSQDASQLAMGAGTVPAFDAAGRLIYRGALRLPTVALTGMTTGASPDSMDIDRLDLKTRRVDTAGYFKILKISISATQTEKGLSLTGTVVPVQMIDDWAVLSDGTLAIVRGLDYHVDFVATNGSVTRGPKVPFTWQPLNDEAKTALLDSVRVEMTQPAAPGGGGQAGAQGGHSMSAMHGGSGIPMTMKLASPSDLPDYLPAFEQNAAKADADGSLWVRTTATRTGAIGGPIYDVIDRSGALVDRIQVPGGRRVLGFGRGGVVYLVARDASGSWIERAHRPK